MSTNLTTVKIKDSFQQLLHIDGGPEAAAKTVYSGAGTATALRVGTANIEVDNIRIDGNTISAIGGGQVVIPSVNIAGGAITNVTFTGSFTGITLIESEEFHTVNGGDGLKITDYSIVADGVSTDIDINITPKGTGEVNISKVDIDGGTIDGTTVGAAVAASVRGTTVTATTSIGYPVGTGGVVTQDTNKATPVTLNKISGQITMNNATLNRASSVTFTLNNSFIAATDVVLVNIASGATADVYSATVSAVAAGSCNIQLRNHTSGTDLGEAVVLNFVVIKGAHS
jgi:hypothetical protein